MKYYLIPFILIALFINNNVSAQTLDTLTICNGQTININGTLISSAGQYSITFQPGDSVVTYTVYVSSPFVSLGDDIVVCERTIGMLVPQGSGGYYTWNNGMVADSIFLGTSGIYSVTLTDVYGCTASDEIEVNIMPNPDPVIEGIPDPICLPSNDIVLTGLPAGGTFSGDLLNNNNFLASQAAVGFYNVYYSYTDSFGCSSTVNAYIQVAICTGVEELINTLQFTILQDRVLMNDDVVFAIYQLDGRMVQQGATNNKIIYTGTLQEGIYLLEVVAGNTRKCISFYRAK